MIQPPLLRLLRALPLPVDVVDHIETIARTDACVEIISEAIDSLDRDGVPTRSLLVRTERALRLLSAVDRHPWGLMPTSSLCPRLRERLRFIIEDDAWTCAYDGCPIAVQNHATRRMILSLLG